MFDALVAHLAESKREGLDFPLAWFLASSRHPLRGTGEPATLFDEQGERHVSANEFLKEACRNAYEDLVGAPGSGNGPALRYFRVDMLSDADDSRPARRAIGSRSRRRQAA